MAITSFDQYKNLVSNAYQRSNETKVSTTTVAGRHYSLWLATPDGGTAPTLPVTCSNNTSGAMGQRDSSYTQYLAQIPVSIATSGYMIIADRLSHQAGLSGVISQSVTTNLPTAPLPRYTDGKGVFISADIYSAVGATGVLISASYTNQNGVAGRLTQPTNFGATGFNAASRMILLPLQDGDLGVRSVESVSLSGTTATAGNYGITLFKPLIVLPINDLGGATYLFDSILSMCGNFAKIENRAHLYYQIIAQTTSTGVVLINNRFIEDQS